MPKRFLLAPNSFKGSLTAREVCDIFRAAILRHIPDAELIELPLADGGDGMVDAYLDLCGGERRVKSVAGPFGEPVDAAFALLGGEAQNRSDSTRDDEAPVTATVECAEICGIKKLRRAGDPLRATSAGVGEMLLYLAGTGVKRVLLGLGGSATNDLGLGMAHALGWRFLDAQGADVLPLAENMSRIEHIVAPKEPLGIAVTAACDVQNPLLGQQGATYVFGRQKGGTDESLPVLEAGMAHFAKVIWRDLGKDVADIPASGAAGGLGAATLAFLNGSLEKGIDLMLKTARFDELLINTDMVFTGEGRMDGQSVFGKVPSGVGRWAQKARVPCVALCGALGNDAKAMYDCGITAMFGAAQRPMELAFALAHSRELLERLADNVVRLLL